MCKGVGREWGWGGGGSEGSSDRPSERISFYQDITSEWPYRPHGIMVEIGKAEDRSVLFYSQVNSDLLYCVQ